MFTWSTPRLLATSFAKGLPRNATHSEHRMARSDEDVFGPEPYPILCQPTEFANITSDNAIDLAVYAPHNDSRPL